MQNVKIGIKLTAAFVFIAMATAGLGIFEIVKIGEISHGDERMYNRIVIPLVQLAGQEKDIQMMRVYAYRIAFANDVLKHKDQRENNLKEISALMDVIKSNAEIQKKRRNQTDNERQFGYARQRI
jgi:hypothetical protein